MLKALIGLVGIGLLAGGIFLSNSLQKDEKSAIAMDDKKTAFGSISGEFVPCKWSVKTPERVVAENKSQAVFIQVTNPEKSECDSTLSLRAPGFDFSPPKEEQIIHLKPKSKGSLSWILTPRKTGTYELSVSDFINTQIFGISVTNVFGLSAAQAKFFSILGTLCGPMLTIPWWMDKWIQKRKKSEPPKEAAEKKES